MVRSFLMLSDLSRDDLFSIFDLIKRRKAEIKKNEKLNVLDNKVVGILFEKPSTRTRVGFEAATLRLGGKAIYMASSNMQMRRGEPVKDTARILDDYVHAIVARVYSHKTVEELAEFSKVPIINGLSDRSHPTQGITDLYSILEAKGKLDGLTLTYVGDGNNVCHSLLLGSALVGMNMNVACPKGYLPDQFILDEAKKIAENTGSKFNVTTDVKEASAGADILYTDVWVSMGDDKEEDVRLKAFEGYQINSDLLKVASKDALVMHCLPAHRGHEITDEVMEGEHSIIWEQGANKMFGAAGVLEFFMNKV